MLSETKIVSPLAFFPSSPAPKGRRKRGWRRSQLCTIGKCLPKKTASASMVHNPILVRAETQERCGVDLQHSRWASSPSVIVMAKDVSQLASVTMHPLRLLMLTKGIWKSHKIWITPSDISYSTCLSCSFKILLMQNSSLRWDAKIRRNRGLVQASYQVYATK
jgi:hypothetical protein